MGLNYQNIERHNYLLHMVLNNEKRVYIFTRNSLYQFLGVYLLILLSKYRAKKQE